MILLMPLEISKEEIFSTVAVTSQVNHFGHEFEPFYFLQPNPIIDKIVEIIETSSFNREITLQKNHSK